MQPSPIASTSGPLRPSRRRSLSALSLIVFSQNPGAPYRSAKFCDNAKERRMIRRCNPSRGREAGMADAFHVYAGAVRSTEGGKGGVFRRAPGDAASWEALSDGLPDGTEIHAITVHPDNPDIVFIGTT